MSEILEAVCDACYETEQIYEPGERPDGWFRVTIPMQPRLDFCNVRCYRLYIPYFPMPKHMVPWVKIA